MSDQAPQTLEEHIPRCDIKDIHEFPDELKPGERCWNCVTWELIDAEREQARQELLDELEAKLPEFKEDDEHDVFVSKAVNVWDITTEFINAKRKKGDTDDKKEK